jgi:hypothetical protein
VIGALFDAEEFGVGGEEQMHRCAGSAQLQRNRHRFWLADAINACPDPGCRNLPRDGAHEPWIRIRSSLPVP